MSQVIDARAEKKLLCALVEFPRYRQAIFKKLDPTLFGDKAYREVYERFIALQNQGKDVTSVSVLSNDPGLSEAARKSLEIRGFEKTALLELTRADIDRLVDTVIQVYKKRTLYEMDKWLGEQLALPQTPDITELKARIQQYLVEVDTYDTAAQGLKHLGRDSNVSDAYLREKLEKRRVSILKTGFSAIDEHATWSRGNMVLLTAKRGGGKSLLAKSLGLSHFYRKQNVITINLEMDEWEYLCRLFSEVTDINHDVLRKGIGEKQIKQVLAARRSIDDYGQRAGCRWSLRTVSHPKYTPEMLHQELMHQGYDVVIIDYLSLFYGQKKDLWESVYAHTKYLKMMAKNLNCLVYVLGQLNDEGRAKYSRAAEEDTDCWIYWELKDSEPMTTFHHGKARHYKPFTFQLIFDGPHMRFIDPSGAALLTPKEQQAIDENTEKAKEREQVTEDEQLSGEDPRKTRRAEQQAQQRQKHEAAEQKKRQSGKKTPAPVVEDAPADEDFEPYCQKM